MLSSEDKISVKTVLREYRATVYIFYSRDLSSILTAGFESELAGSQWPTFFTPPCIIFNTTL